MGPVLPVLRSLCGVFRPVSPDSWHRGAVPFHPMPRTATHGSRPGFCLRVSRSHTLGASPWGLFSPPATSPYSPFGAKAQFPFPTDATHTLKCRADGGAAPACLPLPPTRDSEQPRGRAGVLLTCTSHPTLGPRRLSVGVP